ncbi:hypothetical protein EMCRGX_G024524 [Ephydatia muelleri]
MRNGKKTNLPIEVMKPIIDPTPTAVELISVIIHPCWSLYEQGVYLLCSNNEAERACITAKRKTHLVLHFGSHLHHLAEKG